VTTVVERYLSGLQSLLRDGGAVMPVLMGMAVLLWFLLTDRALTLRRGVDERDLGRGRVLVTSIAVTAPLLGLLGTVSGMIDTFDALGSDMMSAQTGGIAAGIAEALLATEMGLCVAIPGMLLGRLLDRREAQLRQELACAA
jgi:biopolymer transport protein ExbB/TolQ